MEKKAQKTLKIRLVQTLKRGKFLLQESLPAQKRVYFLYTHRNGFDRFYHGLKANTEISYWLYTALKEKFSAVRFLRYSGEREERLASIRPQDVVVGHAGETLERAARYTRRLIAFNPWAGHVDRSREGFNCLPSHIEQKYYSLCVSLIFLTSEYNKREYLEKNQNFWYPYFQSLQKEKRLHIVHQPIDLNLFKRIKWDYTTNHFLYVGNKAHMKRVEDAESLVAEIGRKLTLYGCGGESLNHLDQRQVDSLPSKADFFIQPGMWEAQCVSILEAAARGFIPLVTPETGYPYDHPFLLKFDDAAYNLRVLRSLLRLSPEEKKVLADTLYEKLRQDENHNSWKVLTDVVVEEVARVMQA